MKKIDRFKRKHKTISLWVVLSSFQEKKLKRVARENSLYGKKQAIKFLIDTAKTKK